MGFLSKPNFTETIVHYFSNDSGQSSEVYIFDWITGLKNNAVEKKFLAWVNDANTEWLAVKVRDALDALVSVESAVITPDFLKFFEAVTDSNGDPQSVVGFMSGVTLFSQFVSDMMDRFNTTIRRASQHVTVDHVVLSATETDIVEVNPMNSSATARDATTCPVVPEKSDTQLEFEQQVADVFEPETRSGVKFLSAFNALRQTDPNARVDLEMYKKVVSALIHLIYDDLGITDDASIRTSSISNAMGIKFKGNVTKKKVVTCLNDGIFEKLVTRFVRWATDPVNQSKILEPNSAGDFVLYLQGSNTEGQASNSVAKFGVQCQTAIRLVKNLSNPNHLDKPLLDTIDEIVELTQPFPSESRAYVDRVLDYRSNLYEEVALALINTASSVDDLRFESMSDYLKCLEKRVERMMENDAEAKDSNNDYCFKSQLRLLKIYLRTLDLASQFESQKWADHLDRVITIIETIGPKNVATNTEVDALQCIVTDGYKLAAKTPLDRRKTIKAPFDRLLNWLNQPGNILEFKKRNSRTIALSALSIFDSSEGIDAHFATTSPDDTVTESYNWLTGLKNSARSGAFPTWFGSDAIQAIGRRVQVILTSQWEKDTVQPVFTKDFVDFVDVVCASQGDPNAVVHAIKSAPLLQSHYVLTVLDIFKNIPQTPIQNTVAPHLIPDEVTVPNLSKSSQVPLKSVELPPKTFGEIIDKINNKERRDWERDVTLFNTFAKDQPKILKGNIYKIFEAMIHLLADALGLSNKVRENILKLQRPIALPDENSEKKQISLNSFFGNIDGLIKSQRKHSIKDFLMDIATMIATTDIASRHPEWCSSTGPRYPAHPLISGLFGAIQVRVANMAAESNMKTRADSWLNTGEFNNHVAEADIPRLDATLTKNWESYLFYDVTLLSNTSSGESLFDRLAQTVTNFDSQEIGKTRYLLNSFARIRGLLTQYQAKMDLTDIENAFNFFIQDPAYSYLERLCIFREILKLIDLKSSNDQNIFSHKVRKKFVRETAKFLNQTTDQNAQFHENTTPNTARRTLLEICNQMAARLKNEVPLTLNSQSGKR